MAKNSYLDSINQIRKTLNETNAKKGNEVLDELFSIKPVSIEWFFAKAEALKLSGSDTGEINFLLEQKYRMLSSPEKSLKLIDYFLNEENDNELERKKLLFHRSLIKISEKTADEAEQKYYDDFINEAETELGYFIDNEEISAENLGRIRAHFYIQQDYTGYLIFDKLYKKLFGNDDGLSEELNLEQNILYLYKMLGADNKAFIVLSDNDSNKYMAAARAVSALGGRVFIVTAPADVEVESKCEPEDTVSISLENASDFYGVDIIPSVRLVLNGTAYADNREQIINYLNENYTENKFSTVISSGNITDELCKADSLKKNMQRLYEHRADYFEKNLTFSWCGDYLAYISFIYGFNAREAIEAKSECDFSIVVPARNSADSLRYTLKTCLEVDYNGKYEIVVSDNSSEGNNEVKNLIEELNDKRIKYYKTPYELTLGRSFEYAYLKSRGDFILSLGSDDGVLPWALNVLKEVKKNFNDDIVIWNRGFYAWPGFNGGQQHHFIVPGSYKKGNINIERRTSQDILKGLRVNIQTMFTMPLLYINSGFKRRYIKTFVEKTGRFLDGICQDLYMGLGNVAINKDFLSIEYPLTIAGMTGKSVGLQINSSEVSIEKINDRFRKSKEHLIGGFSRSSTEDYIPKVMSDAYYLYDCIYRMAARGLWSKEFVDNMFGMKNIYENLASRLARSDAMTEENMEYFRYAAAKNGKEFLEWYDENIDKKLRAQFKYDDTISLERSYTVGFSEGGGLILDASEFGVENIDDAVKLFCKLTGLR